MILLYLLGKGIMLLLVGRSCFQCTYWLLILMRALFEKYFHVSCCPDYPSFWSSLCVILTSYLHKKPGCFPNMQWRFPSCEGLELCRWDSNLVNVLSFLVTSMVQPSWWNCKISCLKAWLDRAFFICECPSSLS